MRLIETTTLAMQTHLGRDIPPYAILSHTWEDEEVTLQDWNSPTRDGMKGFHKMRMTCQLAARDGIKYAWIDTCCIDKSNSAELSEAINSMYRWYKNAKVCYAYLSDLRLPASTPKDTEALVPFLRGCRWFSRGWTLQELIAPDNVLFYQHDWRHVGSKKEWREVLSEVTGIDSEALIQYDPIEHSIATRMSWAADRQTTREEDIAYCLLGIFDINMPMLYGEGTKAFRRLQEEIIRTGYDISIFAWTKPFHNASQVELNEVPICGALAEAPGDFHSIPAHRIDRQWDEVSVTNAGIKLTLELCLVRMPQTGQLSYVLPIRTLGLANDTGKTVFGIDHSSELGVEVEMVRLGKFARKDREKLVRIPRPSETDMVRQIRFPDVRLMIDRVDDPYLWPDHDCFEFPPGCKILKAWPSGCWNDVNSGFMMADEGQQYGSILLDVQSPTLADDDSASAEFMFLFSYSKYNGRPGWDIRCTIVGYREYQLMLDIINLRIGGGDMDIEEMWQTLRNFAIPWRHSSSVISEGTGQRVYNTAEFFRESRTYKFAFKTLVGALESGR
ncbi:Vegetative incompatibility protein HET-E-1 [Colletotrichum tropicale]|nr:Vegetative incompatibility protein HET-E-1 [Colletotrichum tropicale]